MLSNSDFLFVKRLDQSNIALEKERHCFKTFWVRNRCGAQSLSVSKGSTAHQIHRIALGVDRLDTTHCNSNNFQFITYQCQTARASLLVLAFIENAQLHMKAGTLAAWLWSSPDV